MSAADIFWWVALPYLALGIFVVGHIWRWRYDQFGWTSRSTQLQERRMLKWGGPIFHYATFAAIGGHVVGILVPESFTSWLGISEHAYHLFAATAGTVAAVLVIAGVVVLALRRLLVPRDVVAIAGAPLVYKIHATAAWAIWAAWPFTRLVHAWSYPLWYLWRPYIVFRSRRASR